jgi:hypothetical protein
MDEAGQAPVAVTMVSNQIAPRAEVTVEAPAEEETLPESEPPTAGEPTAATKAAFTDIQIPTWNLGERIPIAPEVGDADTPQVDVGKVEEDVDIIKTIGATGNRWLIGHTVQDSRLRTTSGCHGSYRTAGRYDRHSYGNCTSRGGNKRRSSTV